MCAWFEHSCRTGRSVCHAGVICAMKSCQMATRWRGPNAWSAAFAPSSKRSVQSAVRAARSWRPQAPGQRAGRQGTGRAARGAEIAACSMRATGTSTRTATLRLCRGVQAAGRRVSERCCARGFRAQLHHLARSIAGRDVQGCRSRGKAKLLSISIASAVRVGHTQARRHFDMHLRLSADMFTMHIHV